VVNTDRDFADDADARIDRALIARAVCFIEADKVSRRS
jgi:hypothetical protein